MRDRDGNFDYERVRFSRPHAWDLCYNFFKEHPEFFLLDNSESKGWDRAGAELASYLAAFTMFTKKGPLIAANRLMLAYFLENFYRKIAENCLITYDEVYKTGGIIPEKKLFALIGIACETYQEAVRKSNYRISGYKATDVVVSKILMGIFCVIPGYDLCFMTSLTRYKTERGDTSAVTKVFAEDDIVEILALARDKKIQKYLRKQFSGVICTEDEMKKYPIMRLLDLHFWAWGTKNLPKKDPQKADD